jgi:hypothetical protein|tara:strand:+ start:307 stop:501 length:195 start_codon:yes stop_codon:yes gene_type:complete
MVEPVCLILSGVVNVLYQISTHRIVKQWGTGVAERFVTFFQIITSRQRKGMNGLLRKNDLVKYI